MRQLRPKTNGDRPSSRSIALAGVVLLVVVLVVVGVVVAAPREASAEGPPGPLPEPAAAHADVDPEQHDVEGWYTSDQADRGHRAYAEHCAECHSPDLRARSAYISLYGFPALTGAYFWDRWGSQSVHTLLLVIQESMPLHAPGSLDGETYADITAHILRVNGFVAGQRELPSAAGDVQRLVGMPIEPSFARPQARARDVEARRVDDGAPAEAPAAPEREEPEPEPEEPEEREEPEPEPEEPEPDEPEPDEPEPEAAEPDGEAREAWFTEAQVERARDRYFKHCSRCHGAALQGRGVAPSLSGANFMERWDGERVSDLFWVVSALMPLDDQGALGPSTSADLVAYILSRNGFAAGAIELPANEERLERFIITQDGGGR